MEQKKISEIAEKFIAAGVNLAIDDFGSKYSSLSTLSTVPFNVVKVDKSIINDLIPCFFNSSNFNLKSFAVPSSKLDTAR